MKVAGQGGVLIGDLNGLDERLEEARADQVTVDGTAICGCDAGIARIGVEKELRRAVVGAGAEKTVARTDAVSAGELTFCFGLDSEGDATPGVVPAVDVAGLNAGGGGHDFAELTAAVTGSAEGTHGFIPELDVVGEDWRAELGVRSTVVRGACSGCLRRIVL